MLVTLGERSGRPFRWLAWFTRPGMLRGRVAVEASRTIAIFKSGDGRFAAEVDMNRLDLLILAANPVGLSSAPGVRDMESPDGAITVPSTDPLQLDREIRQIRRIVEGSRYRDLVDVDTHLAVNPDDLLPLLRRRSANVVHFCGHSTERGIVLADDHNAPVLVTREALVRVIRAVGSKVELILLNSCTGMEIARSLADVCGCAIGMRDRIGDKAAWTFSRAFYEAFADGVSVQDAVEHGKTALALWGMREEDLPELLCKDGVDPSRLALSGAASRQVKGQREQEACGEGACRGESRSSAQGASRAAGPAGVAGHTARTDRQLDRHEAGADPGRRVPDGLARHRSGGIRR